ncbi:UNVERIFIED_CONTAM: hypothetical protein FKN15_039181 [Acipenser sinensis]
MTEGLDPVCMLTGDATIAKWNNEGLPSDKMSIQNATILTNCEHWHLLIDTQLQGIKWIKIRYGCDLKVISLVKKETESNFLGDNLLVEKLETTKHTTAEIEMKVLEAKVNEVKINEAREHYHPAVARASLLYFIMNDLNKINPMFQFSLKFDRKLALVPGFVVLSNLDYQGYHRYIDRMLPRESPVHYGLHPNAEIEFLTVTSDNLFHTLLELLPRDSVIGEGATQTVEEQIKMILDNILEKLREEYNMSDIISKSAECFPYSLVCFQECERMNTLMHEIRRSLKELDLGLKGELAISSEMEQLQTALFFDNVPDTWTKLAYPSTYSLALWCQVGYSRSGNSRGSSETPDPHDAGNICEGYS